VEATSELQKVLLSIIKNEKIKSINKDLYNAINSIDDFKDVISKQNELIASVKKNHSNHLITEITVQTKGLRKPQDKLIKQLLDAISIATKDYQLNKNKDWKELNLKEHLDKLKALQQQLSGNPDEEEPGLLHETEYFYKQALWLTNRFPDGVYTDVEGLCKVVTQKEIEAKD